MSDRYTLARQSLKTGDIILFSGSGVISRIIKIGTRSKWTHVGVVIRLPEYYDGVMLLESTTMNKAADVITGRVTRGVSLVALSERVRNFGGVVGMRRLINVERNNDFISAFSLLRREMNGRKYERSIVELIMAAIDIPFFRNKSDLSTVFCSELVAEGYIRAGLLAATKPANEYTPADFSTMQPTSGMLTCIEEIRGG